MPQYDMQAIQAALVAAGVNVGAGLVGNGDEFFIAQPDGTLAPVPAETIAALGTLPTLPTKVPDVAQRVATALAQVPELSDASKQLLAQALAGG